MTLIEVQEGSVTRDINASEVWGLARYLQQLFIRMKWLQGTYTCDLNIKMCGF